MTADTIQIQASGNKYYEVSFADSLSALTTQLTQLKDPVFFVDSNIAEQYPQLMSSLSAAAHIIVATEETKTLQGATAVLEKLSSAGVARHSTVVAIGGGIAQDIVSFAAHVYYRGLRFVFVPTTLLAMCDSCIGGKCGLNFNGYKNQLGAFHPPEKVLIWEGFLDSLPDEALYSGYGEIFKFMLIGGQSLFDRFKTAFPRDGIRGKGAREYIRQGLLIKKQFIEEDEFDNGVRRILNYGHTFGHALELATAYRIPHGIAVAYGIDIANQIAVEHGILPEALQREVHGLVHALFPFDVYTGITAETLLESVRRDKKAVQGKVDMALLKTPGEFVMQSILIDKSLGCIVQGCLSASERVS